MWYEDTLGEVGKQCFWVLVIGILVPGLGWARVIYVDDDAPAGGDGRSWETAFRFLQNGLAVAEAGDEIRVAQGVYKPDRSSVNPAGSRDREVSFVLVNGTILKGGYAGLGAQDPNKRYPDAYVSVLSADLNGDDLPVDDPRDLYGETSRLENTNHVVIADRSTTIDGFLVTGGRAIRIGSEGGDAGPLAWNSGGGIYVIGNDVSINNCVIQGNLAFHGGGGIHVWKDLTGIRLANCRFVGNANDGYSYGGGGLFAWSSQIEITDCEFVGNWTRLDGGGAYCNVDEVRFRGCRFVENKSGSWEHWGHWGRGGGVFVDNGEAYLSRCLFKHNMSGRLGGGGYFHDQVTMNGCTLIGNRSKYGGALAATGGGIYFNNSGFYGNFAEIHGGALSTNQLDLFIVRNCNFLDNKSSYGAFLAAANMYFPVVVRNCIIRNEEQEIYTFNQNDIEFSIGFSVINTFPLPSKASTNLELTSGNIDVEPCFVDPGYWDDRGTPDDPNDDFYVAGDYHFKSQGGRWDPVTQGWIQDDVSSPCIDAGDPNSPISLEPFPNGGRINIGAYGGTVEASKSYFGSEPCLTIIAGDINGDCRVDLLDLTILVSHWLEDRNSSPDRNIQ